MEVLKAGNQKSSREREEKMRTKLVFLFSVLIIASMILAACKAASTPTVAPGSGTTDVPAAEPSVAKSADPSTLLVLRYAEPDTLDPALDYETAGAEIIRNIYDPLLFYKAGDPSQFIPMLATDWTISDDGLTYTFNIRKGVKFQDGTDMTVDDVAYSFQRNLLFGGPDGPMALLAEPFFGVGNVDVTYLIDPALYGDVAGLQAIDHAVLKSTCETVKSKIVADAANSKVTMTLANSWGPFLQTIGQNWAVIMSKAWSSANGAWDGSCDTWQNFYAVSSAEDPLTSIAMGTGPFSLDHWTPGEELVMVRNDNYWRTEPMWEGESGGGGPAKLARIVIRQVTEWGTRFSMMQTGEADLAIVNPDAWAQADEFVGTTCTMDASDPATYSNPTCNTTSDQPLTVWAGAPRPAIDIMTMNEAIDTNNNSNPYMGSGALDGNGIPADFFADVHIRKAFNFCYDWDTVIADAFGGNGFQPTSLLLPGMIGYSADDPHYTYDPAKCEEEFKASSLKNAAGQSVWDKGFFLIGVFNIGNTGRQTALQVLAAGLKAVNPKFRLESVGMPWPTINRELRNHRLALTSIGWLEDIHDPHNWYGPFLASQYAVFNNVPAAEWGVLDKVSNAVMESDPVVRAGMNKEINQIVYDQAPYIIGVARNIRQYLQPWVKGYYYNPLIGDNLFYFYPMWKE
jgi:peptide/nickel transport system substrate-binding protein